MSLVLVDFPPGTPIVLPVSSTLRLVGSLLVFGGLLLGCSVEPPTQSVGPTGQPPATATSQPVAASPTALPTTGTRRTDPPSLVGLPIDARRVLAKAGTECTGGPVGGEASETMNYDFWTLHCPADATSHQKLVDALRAEAELLGATVCSEGEVGSGNAGNEGDHQTTLECEFEDVDIRIRVTSLVEPGAETVVVTIDQRKL